MKNLKAGKVSKGVPYIICIQTNLPIATHGLQLNMKDDQRSQAMLKTLVARSKKKNKKFHLGRIEQLNDGPSRWSFASPKNYQVINEIHIWFYLIYQTSYKKFFTLFLQEESAAIFFALYVYSQKYNRGTKGGGWN